MHHTRLGRAIAFAAASVGTRRPLLSEAGGTHVEERRWIKGIVQSQQAGEGGSGEHREGRVNVSVGMVCTFRPGCPRRKVRTRIAKLTPPVAPLIVSVKRASAAAESSLKTAVPSKIDRRGVARTRPCASEATRSRPARAAAWHAALPRAAADNAVEAAPLHTCDGQPRHTVTIDAARESAGMRRRNGNDGKGEMRRERTCVHSD